MHEYNFTMDVSQGYRQGLHVLKLQLEDFLKILNKSPQYFVGL